MHKAGFVNFIGIPNVGKSSLLNALAGQKLSIVSHKPQTTRNRIRSIKNAEKFQIIWCDNPGLIHETHYKMHEELNAFNKEAFRDSDILVLVVDGTYTQPENNQLFDWINKQTIPTIVLLNKADKYKKEVLEQMTEAIKIKAPNSLFFKVSALKPSSLKRFEQKVIKLLPESEPYFDKEFITDHNMRFLTAELVREKIFHNYKDEIPYCCFVQVSSYKETEVIDKISCEIFVERESQKKIIIGAAGSSIKKIGTQVRIELEKMLEKKVFLELNVKVKENWRNDEKLLTKFGLKGSEN